jgi:pyruvate/2-oxoglutarate dehydrogenase complex dihydrolipoamide acyltransferase (E2) component
MRTSVNFPKSGMGISEGTVVRWLKAVGEVVRQGEPLVEIETAKALQEVEAPANGTLTEILVGPGAEVEVNASLGTIETRHE